MSSKARKHVLQALDGVLEEEEGEEVARVLEVKGGNILLVESESGESCLVLIPSRYKGLTMFTRGSVLMVVLEEDRATNACSKVVGTVSRPLSQHLLAQLGRALPAHWGDEAPPARAPSSYVDASFLPPGSSEEDELCSFSHRANARRVDSSSSEEDEE